MAQKRNDPAELLERYGNHRPTIFDYNIAIDAGEDSGPFADRAEWFLAPVCHTRDSGPLDESNFQSASESLAEADPDGADYEVHRFGHWGPGWYEIIIVRPETPAARCAADLASALENYPVLDDDDHSERELKDAEETWRNCYTIKERYRLWADLREYEREGYNVFSIRSETMPMWAFERCRTQ